MNKPLKGFITYSHKDKKAKNKLLTCLEPMKREGLIDPWHDNEIIPGDKWREEIFSTNLPDSDIWFYLVSSDSLASETCNKELALVLEKNITPILIILEDCDWKNYKLSNVQALSAENSFLSEWKSQTLSDFQALPARGKPLNEWNPRSKGWQSVVEGIREVVHKIQLQTMAELAFKQGNFLLTIRQIDQAIVAYSRAIELNPRYIEAYSNRGTAYERTGNYEKAIEDYDNMIVLNPKSSAAYNNRGTIHAKKGEYNLAIADFSKAIGFAPDYVEAYCNRGTAYYLQNEFEIAIENYNKAAALNPHHAGTYNNRGAAYGSKGEHTKAIKDFTTSIELNPRDAMTYNNRGLVYANKLDFDQAIKDYNKAIELNSDFAEAYYNRGNLHGKKGDVDKAIEDHTKTIDLKPDYDAAYITRGTFYGEKGELDKAIKDFDTAIELKPGNAFSYHNRGTAHRGKGEFDIAIKDYTKAIELKPDDAEVYVNRGGAYNEKGEFNKAIEDLSKAIQLNPELAEAYVNRGNAYSSKDDFQNAIENYNMAIELKPDLAETYVNRGNFYSRKGDFQNAIENYNMAIELKPDLAETYHFRGNIYNDKREFQNAIRDYNMAAELNSNFADTYNNRGVVYIRMGEVKRAIEDYNRAIQLKPDSTDAYCNRGEAWLHLQEWDKAKADLITAKEMGMDIIASFRNDYKNVEAFEQRHRVKLPEDIALLLTQRRRDRFPKKRRVLDADGKPLESPNVVNLRAQLRNAGPPLGEYVKSKPSFGINTAPTEAFVIDKGTRDKFIAAHPASADILKPFLHGQDLRRWHVDTPQQWLIFTHRGIAINDYPAILKHLEKYQETLSKRKGKQKWYELPVSLRDTERFAQPKLVCPDTYNHQTFAVDAAGYYYGKTAYLIPTEGTWLCGLLNSRTVEWFYSQVSKQLTIDWLRARSGYIQQIPIPDITPVHKALIAKIVDYLIYLQQQPTINSKDLAYARDRIMLGYFERVIDGLVYEVYLAEDLHKGDKHFFQPLLKEQLPLIEDIEGDKMSVFRDIFELLYEKTHPIRRNLFFLDSVKPVRIIEGKL